MKIEKGSGPGMDAFNHSGGDLHEVREETSPEEEKEIKKAVESYLSHAGKKPNLSSSIRRLISPSFRKQLKDDCQPISEVTGVNQFIVQMTIESAVHLSADGVNGQTLSTRISDYIFDIAPALDNKQKTQRGISSICGVVEVLRK